MRGAVSVGGAGGSRLWASCIAGWRGLLMGLRGYSRGCPGEPLMLATDSVALTVLGTGAKTSVAPTKAPLQGL